MNRSVILSFISGAALGVASTWLLLKQKYEKKSQEDYAELKGYFTSRLDSAIKAEQARNKPDLVTPTYDETVELYSGNTESEEGPKEGYSEEPYMISFGKYQEHNSFEKLSVKYYLEDDMFTSLEDFPVEITAYVNDEIMDILSNANNPEDDMMYVRNEAYGVDLEVERIFLGMPLNPEEVPYEDD